MNTYKRSDERHSPVLSEPKNPAPGGTPRPTGEALSGASPLPSSLMERCPRCGRTYGAHFLSDPCIIYLIKTQGRNFVRDLIAN
jgi:hypothetical protein